MISKKQDTTELANSKSVEPVSKTTVNGCGGVPTCTRSRQPAMYSRKSK